MTREFDLSAGKRVRVLFTQFDAFLLFSYLPNSKKGWGTMFGYLLLYCVSK